MKQIFKYKNVLIMGLGLIGGGVGVAKFFAKKGAKLLVTDLRTRKELKPSLEKLKPFTFQKRKVKGKGLPIKFVLGKHRAEDFKNADLIIKNPAVPPNSPYLKIAKKHKIPIKTDISIFFDLCPAPIIGVTGTKGKSTVATLIYLFLKKKYPKTILAGNIGISPLEILSRITKKSKVVLELSSFELEDLKKSPHIAVITTLFPDHLNRYKSFNDYIEAKRAIFKYQKKNDILVLNYNNKETRKLASESSGKVYFFEDSNVSAAIKVAQIFNVSKKDIERVLSNFKGVPSRQEFVASKKGVKYFNDTTATTPQSVILAIKRFSNSKITLIAGGVDKNLNYKNLAREIKKSVSYLILLPGTASNKIERELKNFTPLEITKTKKNHKAKESLTGFRVFSAKSMNEAVKRASRLAEKGGIVLLSPGAASFNLFKNEFDRGKQFVKAVKEL